nr:hypothetical protein [Tanacetum cinerariifolium]
VFDALPLAILAALTVLPSHATFSKQSETPSCGVHFAVNADNR